MKTNPARKFLLITTDDYGKLSNDFIHGIYDLREGKKHTLSVNGLLHSMVYSYLQEVTPLETTKENIENVIAELKEKQKEYTKERTLDNNNYTCAIEFTCNILNHVLELLK